MSHFSSFGDEAPSVSVDCWRSVLDDELLIDDEHAGGGDRLRLGRAGVKSFSKEVLLFRWADIEILLPITLCSRERSVRNVKNTG